MVYIRLASLLTLTLLLVGCGKAQIQYADKQTNNIAPASESSNLSVAQSAYAFEDKDIEVPANFDTQGLANCNFSAQESEACPLKKKVVRIYFGENDIVTKNNEERAALTQLNNERLGYMLENQLAGLNRFRIVTQDTIVEREQATQFERQDVMKMAEVVMDKTPLRPDYAVKIDTIKTAERFYAEYNGLARYNIEMTASVIDPFTREKLSYPNLGKIRVKGTDVRDKEFFVYTQVNNRYYTGFNYTDQDNINAVFSGMASKAFDVLISRLLTEMPSSAQVLAFRNDQISLDRGRNAGILNRETMIVFGYQDGFVDPIAVAEVKPSSNSGVGKIVKWKDTDFAKSFRKSAKNKVFKPTQKVFAVSVGLPQDYIENRL